MREYGYLNARLRAMKTRLLGRAAVESLTKVESVPALAAGLLGTTYKPDLEWGRLRKPGIAGLEEGLRHHVVMTVQKVAKCAKDNPEASAILRILVGRWDVHNLRTLLRGHHISATPSEVRESLMPVGELDESQLIELSGQDSLKAVIDLLAMWRNPYARALSAGYSSYAQTHDLSALELKLDQFHYQHLLESTRRWLPVAAALALVRRRRIARPISGGRTLSVGLVREVVLREIDVVNIVTLLRLAREGLAPEEYRAYFIPGGKTITPERFTRLAGKDVDSVVAGLAVTPYAPVLRAGLDQFHQRQAVSVLERRLEEYLVTQSVSLFRGDLLSSAVMIAYFAAKFNELVNLRLLARGKEVRMPEARIREALILV